MQGLMVNFSVLVALATVTAGYKISSGGTCEYDGKVYTDGVFHLSPCVECTCDGNSGGGVRCRREPCPDVLPQNCAKVDVPNGDCCPQCVEFGCLHEGNVYKKGAEIPNQSCKRCFCSWRKDDYAVNCYHHQCPSVDCRGAYVPDGECCARCPGTELRNPWARN